MAHPHLLWIEVTLLPPPEKKPRILVLQKEYSNVKDKAKRARSRHRCLEISVSNKNLTRIGNFELAIGSGEHQDPTSNTKSNKDPNTLGNAKKRHTSC